MRRVNDLKSALDAYWSSSTYREEEAAYHEILLFGGGDGYRVNSPIMTKTIQIIRRLALWMEKFT